MLDQKQIDRCKDVLNSGGAVGFEQRVVAETNLYWIIYERCSSSTVDFPGTQAELHAWKHKWKFLFGNAPDRLRVAFLLHA